MADRLYDNLDLSGITDLQKTEIGTPTYAGTDKFNLHAICDADHSLVSVDWVRQGTIDFEATPAIPSNAVITSVRCTADITGVWTNSGDENGSFSGTWGIYNSSPLVSPTYFDIHTEPDSQGGSVSTQIEWEATGLTFTRDDLIAQFSNPCVSISPRANANDVDEVLESTVTLINWTMIVTYDGGSFSWYIKPTITKVNGNDTKIIESEDDIIQVPPGEDPPPGFEFYGSSEDYPDGPLYLWWESNDVYEFYIFSPINPTLSIIWLPLPGEPTCDGCLTLTLGSLDVLVANASGIYTLTAGKVNDSLYTREGFSVFVDTIEVKIPDPTVRFGFIP